MVFIAGPVLFLIGSIQLGGFLADSVSDSDFEREMMQLDEVQLFYEKYPNPEVSHSSDIIAWKQIHYDAISQDGNQSAHLFVKKSMLHGGVRMQLSCVYDLEAYSEYHMRYHTQSQKDNVTQGVPDESEFALHLDDRDEITRHLKGKNCFEDQS